MKKPLSGKKALVTGGTRGIGRAIAERLVRDGAKVTVTGTKPAGKPPRGCVYEGVDFTDPRAAEEFAAAMSRRGFDVLVNCAGINRVAGIAEIATDDFDAIHSVNLRSPMLLCRALVPGMRRRRWGRVVNITSVFAVVSRGGRVSYSASKFGLDGLTASLAAEVARDGVLVNSLAPGFVDTDLTRRVLGRAGMKAMAAMVPLGRLARPAEIAALAAWLTGPENSYCSGQSFVIDGGFTRV